MTKKPLVSISVLTFNSEDIIGHCLKSALDQSYDNIEILVIDNASSDNTVEVVKQLKDKYNSNLNILINKENIGFAKGHNIGIRKSRGEYVLCLNQDVVLDKDFVKNAVELMEFNKNVGGVQGKLYKTTKLNMCEVEPRTSRILDSTGLLMFKNRRIVARGQGEKDKNQYQRGEIFGADGPAPFYRRRALEDTKLPTFKGSTPNIRLNPGLDPGKSGSYEYFDEDFFMYKEDVDLAWRMQLYGWKTIYEPTVVGHHVRGAGQGAVTNYLKVAKARMKISKLAKYHSFKNQRLMQIKNELWGLMFRHFFRIIIKEIASWIYVLLFEKYSLKVIQELFKKCPKARCKRKIIMQRKRKGAKQMKELFN